MEEEKITISVNEYKRLLETSVRVEIFADHVNKRSYLDREDCGKYLGFKVVPIGS